MKTIKQRFTKYKKQASVQSVILGSPKGDSRIITGTDSGQARMTIILILLLLIISLWASLPLLRSGFIPTHDGEYHIIRFWQFFKVLSSGVWFPRWAPDLNNGYGIPLFNFVYPLPNYAAAFFHFSGFSFTDCLKMVLLTGFIISGFSFYLLMRFFFKPLPSFLGSILYLLAPYHLVDVYIRGSVGEVWALGIAPLVLYFGLSKKYALYSAGLALLILSHNILALMFFIFIILFLIFYNLSLRAPSEVEGRGNLFSLTEIASSFSNGELLAMTMLGLGLSAFFWLPALWEKQYAVGLEQVSFSNHFPEIWQLIFPSGGTGFSGTGISSNQMSFQIGLVHLLVIVLAIYWLLKHVVLGRSETTTPKSKRNGFWTQLRKSYAGQASQNDDRTMAIFLLICFLAVLFLITPFSLFLWNTIPLLSYFQYPWRFLSLVIFISSFLGAWMADRLNKKWLSLVLIILAILLYGPYTRPVVYQQRQDSFYLNNPDWTKGTDSPGNSFNTIWFQNNKKAVFVKGEKTIPIAYFPGWQVFVDGAAQKTYPNKDGLVSFIRPEGKHKIEVRFLDTPIRQWAKYISLISVMVLIINGLKSWKPYKHVNK